MPVNSSVLVFSSHQRCHRIHHDLVVQRALAGQANRHILFVAMSETVQNGSELERQVESWESFRWFFDGYRAQGLEASPFYWTSGLSQSDVDLLWRQLSESEVVILGGGSSALGMSRFKDLGARFAGDAGRFGELLRARQAAGKLTAGYSAGADQLCQDLYRRSEGLPGEAFGLLRGVMISLHHAPSSQNALRARATRVPESLLFGLPNDSAISAAQGTLPSGRDWQRLDFVIDQSWDRPEDRWHVRTRDGALVDHYYPDGRHWAFRDGHSLLRIWSADRRANEAWIAADGRLFQYRSQQPAPFGSFDEVLAAH